MHNVCCSKENSFKVILTWNIHVVNTILFISIFLYNIFFSFNIYIEDIKKWVYIVWFSVTIV